MSAAVAPPLLRSPPFPWVEPAVAAVSEPGTSTLDDPDRLFAAMRVARVGGAFWSARDPWSDAGARDDGAEAAIIRWIIDGRGGANMRARAIAAIEAARRG